MFDVVKKLVKNVDTDKYKCSGYAIGFNRRGTFPVANGFDRNAIIFEVDMSFSVHVHNKKNIFEFLVKVLRKD